MPGFSWRWEDFSGRWKHRRPAPYVRAFSHPSRGAVLDSSLLAPTLWRALPTGQQLCPTAPGCPFRAGRAQPSVWWLCGMFSSQAWAFLPPQLGTRMCDSNPRSSTSPEILMTFKIGKNESEGVGTCLLEQGFEGYQNIHEQCGE